MPTITIISDTHGDHYRCPEIKPCDILIHCGDCTSDGGGAALRDFIIWFEKQAAFAKVLVAGNHDWAFEKDHDLALRLIDELAPSVVYLQDGGCSIDGVFIWGSPVQPEFFNWAFNRKRGEEIKRHWDLIPYGVDVLVTHGPSHGILDKAKPNGQHLGCEELKKAIERIKPKVHCFGHIHGSYGKEMKDGTLHINASLMNEKYALVNQPVTVNL